MPEWHMLKITLPSIDRIYKLDLMIFNVLTNDKHLLRMRSAEPWNEKNNSVAGVLEISWMLEGKQINHRGCFLSKHESFPSPHKSPGPFVRLPKLEKHYLGGVCSALGHANCVSLLNPVFSSVECWKESAQVFVTKKHMDAEAIQTALE